ncbi:hypothetical protein Pint_18729 [Pistacia integerrima]|uniref:Uncharacterized protein n=1 Tax=Pistacia integerrima TaxID=434235 RepID=A0ACC0YVV1_9ROSI|nr:hypothetical protein Pint_18729 [Pistacia integerrima]
MTADGVILCEGEDIDPSMHGNETNHSAEELEFIKQMHAGDTGHTTIDNEKRLDRTESILPRHSVELSKKCPEDQRVSHINYDDYDGHPHLIKVVENIPLHVAPWFKDSDEKENVEISVNSYHHQGVKRLAQQFVLIAFALDDLIEGFDGPKSNNLKKEFVNAVISHKKKVINRSLFVPKPCTAGEARNRRKLKRKIMVGSFSLARGDMNTLGQWVHSPKNLSSSCGRIS